LKIYAQKWFKLFEKNMFSIVFYTYYNIYSTFQLNTLQIYHYTFCRSVEIVGFQIFMF